MRVAPRAPGAVLSTVAQRRINENRGAANQQEQYAPDDLVRPHTVDPAAAGLVSTSTAPNKLMLPIMRLKGVIREATWSHALIWPYVDAMGSLEVAVVVFEVKDAGKTTRISQLARGIAVIDGSLATANGRLPYAIELDRPVRMVPTRRYAVGLNLREDGGNPADVRGVGSGIPVAYAYIAAPPDPLPVDGGPAMSMAWDADIITRSADAYKAYTTGGFVASGVAPGASLDAQATRGSMSPLVVMSDGSTIDTWY